MNGWMKVKRREKDEAKYETVEETEIIREMVKKKIMKNNEN